MRLGELIGDRNHDENDTSSTDGATPQDIVSGGTPANPVKSAFQTNIISIRVRAMLAYAVAPVAPR